MSCGAGGGGGGLILLASSLARQIGAAADGARKICWSSMEGRSVVAKVIIFCLSESNQVAPKNAAHRRKEDCSTGALIPLNGQQIRVSPSCEVS